MTGQYGLADWHVTDPSKSKTYSLCLLTSMVCGIPDARGRKLCRAGACSNSQICEACDGGQAHRQTATGKLIPTAHSKELQPSVRSNTLSDTHLSPSTPHMQSHCGPQQGFHRSMRHPRSSWLYFRNKQQTVTFTPPLLLPLTIFQICKHEK